MEEESHQTQDECLSEELLQVILYESESEEDEDCEIPEVPETESDSDENEFFQANWNRNERTGNRSNSDHFLSKNGKIKWFKSPPEFRGLQIGSTDIDCSKFGVQEWAKFAKNPLEAFSLFFDAQVLEMMVTYSNIYIRRMGKRYERSRDCRETSVEEMSALIGLLLFSSVMKTPHFNFKDMWAQDGTGMDLFRLTMSFGRFRFLIRRCLRFDNFELRRTTMKQDKLTPVRELMNLVLRNFRRAFVPGKSVSVYEHVIPFKGKFPFKMMSTGKPKKCGINLLSLADSRNFYSLSFEIMTEKKRMISAPESKTIEVVGHLVQGFEGSYRDVIMDKCCTDLSLARAIRQHGLSFIGTCYKSDKDIPREFNQIRKSVRSSLYGFTDEFTLVSYIPKRKEIQVFLSSRISDRNIDLCSSKPDLVTAVESSDFKREEFRQSVDSMNVGFKTKRWPLLVFFHLLYTAARNAQIILSENVGSTAPTGSEFIKQLSLSLIKNRMEVRSVSGHIPKEMRKRIRLSFDLAPRPAPEEGPHRGRCHICCRKRDIKSRQRCCVCRNFICKEHSKVTCNDCLDGVLASSAVSYYEPHPSLLPPQPSTSDHITSDPVISDVNDKQM